MKVRTDFVTNSSSSSFIFGTPGEVSGLTREDICCALDALYLNIANAQNLVVHNLKVTNKALYDKMLKAQHYIGVYNQNKVQFQDKTVIAFHDRATLMCQEIRDTEDFQKIVKQAYDMFLKHAISDWDTFRFYFSNYIILDRLDVNLHEQINEIKKYIYDLKGDRQGNKNTLIEMIHYHQWKDSIDTLVVGTDEYEFYHNGNRDMDLNKLAFRQLGEFAIYGIDQLEICDMLKIFMQYISN